MVHFPDVYCHHCGKRLGGLELDTFKNCYSDIAIIDAKQIPEMRKRHFCNRSCFDDYIKQFEVEKYKGNSIYKLRAGGQDYYLPYWLSRYAFTTIEDCRKRINDRFVATVSMSDYRYLYNELR